MAEDVCSDVALALAELCIQNYDTETVAGLVGTTHAAAWQQMTPGEFNARYFLEVVAGSMEKPNSVFKKKEAVQVAQAIGQFAQAAPGAALRIMLRVLEQAFTEVTIKPEDWDALDQEITATLQRGNSVQGAGGQAQGGQGGAPQQQNIQQVLQNAPPEFKQKIVQLAQQGPQGEAQIKQLVQQYMQTQGGGGQPQPQQQQAQPQPRQ